MNIAVFSFGFSDLVFIAFVLGIAFWAWMLIDCATKEVDPTEKIVWILLIVFVGVVGAPGYFLFRKLRRKKQSASRAR